VANRTSQAAVSNLESGARLASIGILVNCILSIAKILAGTLGHSYVLIADGIESTLDIFSSLILWGALRLAARPPDATHPYGHGKAEPIAAIIGSLVVIAAAVGLAFQSVREILTPHHAPAPFTLLVLIVVVAAKETLFRRVIEAADHAQSTAMKSDALHHRSDAITSVAAFIGISVALVGGKFFPNLPVRWEAADDWAARFACALIANNG